MLSMLTYTVCQRGTTTCTSGPSEPPTCVPRSSSIPLTWKPQSAHWRPYAFLPSSGTTTLSITRNSIASPNSSFAILKVDKLIDGAKLPTREAGLSAYSTWSLREEGLETLRHAGNPVHVSGGLRRQQGHFRDNLLCRPRKSRCARRSAWAVQRVGRFCRVSRGPAG